MIQTAQLLFAPGNWAGLATIIRLAKLGDNAINLHVTFRLLNVQVWVFDDQRWNLLAQLQCLLFGPLRLSRKLYQYIRKSSRGCLVSNRTINQITNHQS